MQWGWILCHRALYTWRKHKAAQARTISMDSELSWSGCTSPRHTNSWIFRGAHLLLQSLRWEMDFRHFISPFFYYYTWKLKGQAKVLNSARVLHKQLLLQRDLFLPEQQHLDMSAHPNPHPGYFHLQLFCHGHHLRPNHTTAITPPPRLLLLFVTKHNLGLIVRSANATWHHGQGLPWAAWGAVTTSTSRRVKLYRKSSLFSILLSVVIVSSLSGLPIVAAMREMPEESVFLHPGTHEEPLTDVRY